MIQDVDIALSDLRDLLDDTGRDGGLIGPSIYDTARVICLAPPAEGPQPALDWLLEQQQDDGGWGSPSMPRSRDVPTLAALIALHVHGAQRKTGAAIQRGLGFLSRHTAHWVGSLVEEIPVGVELLLPSLLDEAERHGMAISRAPYASLIALGERRRARITQQCSSPGALLTAHFSWEGWGGAADPALLDPFRGVCHSPAATAAWLRRADLGLSVQRAAAWAYLERANRATGVAIPGVVPNFWPYHRFEQCFVLQAVQLSGLLDHPDLTDAVRWHLDDLEAALPPAGFGMSDHFFPDGDTTAAAMTVLCAGGRRVDPQILLNFASDEHFYGYRQELQSSISVTANAIYALQLLGAPTAPYERYVSDRQLADGLWPGDKWNISWLYPTWRCMVALGSIGQIEPMRRASSAILRQQHPDGGWGMAASSSEETAYAILALRYARAYASDHTKIDAALARGDRWLRAYYDSSVPSPVACWLSKDLYRPTRMARAFELCAMLSCWKDLDARAVNSL